MRLHSSEPEHGPLPSSRGRLTALDAIIGVAACVLLVGIAEFRHRSLVGAQAIGGDTLEWLGGLARDLRGITRR